MLKKTLLLAAIVAALFAVPAAASAAVFTHSGSPITETTVLKFTGTVQFEAEGGAGGIHCPTAHVTISADPGGTGHVTEFTGTECETFGFLNEVLGCHVEGHPTFFGPWNVAATARGVAKISGIDIVNDMNEACAVGTEIAVVDGEVPVTATADNAEAITKVTLAGKVETNVGPSTVSGELKAEEPGTYGIE